MDNQQIETVIVEVKDKLTQAIEKYGRQPDKGSLYFQLKSSSGFWGFNLPSDPELITSSLFVRDGFLVIEKIEVLNQKDVKGNPAEKAGSNFRVRTYSIDEIVGYELSIYFYDSLD